MGKRGKIDKIQRADKGRKERVLIARWEKTKIKEKTLWNLR